jgi:ATP-dependent DNA helicase RecQ
MRLAEERSVPPYVIASDKTLIELAHYLPINKSELLGINGFGEVKANRYGNEFLEMIKENS